MFRVGSNIEKRETHFDYKFWFESDNYQYMDGGKWWDVVKFENIPNVLIEHVSKLDKFLYKKTDALKKITDKRWYNSDKGDIHPMIFVNDVRSEMWDFIKSDEFLNKIYSIHDHKERVIGLLNPMTKIIISLEKPKIYEDRSKESIIDAIKNCDNVEDTLRSLYREKINYNQTESGNYYKTDYNYTPRIYLDPKDLNLKDNLSIIDMDTVDHYFLEEDKLKHQNIILRPYATRFKSMVNLGKIGSDLEESILSGNKFSIDKYRETNLESIIDSIVKFFKENIESTDIKMFIYKYVDIIINGYGEVTKLMIKKY